MELGEIAAGRPRTELLYLREMNLRRGQSKILAAVPEKRTHVYLVLDRTIFHPKGGGQPSDRGRIYSPSYDVTMKKASYYKGVVIHWGKLTRGNAIDGEATCELDWEYRWMVMRRHTAAHLLDHCLGQATGMRVQTTESWLDQPCYVAYTGRAPSTELLRRTERLANELIRKGARVTIDFLTRDQAEISLKNAPNYERLPDVTEIRTVTIEGCNPIPCGGTHVGNIAAIRELTISGAEQLPTAAYRLHFAVSATASFA